VRERWRWRLGGGFVILKPRNPKSKPRPLPCSTELEAGTLAEPGEWWRRYLEGESNNRGVSVRWLYAQQEPTATEEVNSGSSWPDPNKPKPFLDLGSSFSPVSGSFSLESRWVISNPNLLLILKVLMFNYVLHCYIF